MVSPVGFTPYQFTQFKGSSSGSASIQPVQPNRDNNGAGPSGVSNPNLSLYHQITQDLFARKPPPAPRVQQATAPELAEIYKDPKELEKIARRQAKDEFGIRFFPQKWLACVGPVLARSGSRLGQCYQQYKHYIDNPYALQTAVREQRQPVVNERGELYTYQAKSAQDAQRIRTNIDQALKGAPMLNKEQVHQSIMSAAKEFSLLPQMQDSLQRIVNNSRYASTHEEMCRVWTYLSTVKQGDERQRLTEAVLNEWAMLQGCEHGRENQVLLALKAIDPVAWPKTIDTVPKIKTKKNLDSYIGHHPEFLAEVQSVLTHAEQQNEAGLTDKQALDALTQVFVKGKPLADGTGHTVRLSQQLIMPLYDELQNRMNSV